MRQALVKSGFIGGILIVAFVLSVAIADEKTDKVDELFAKWDSTVSPGAALAIIKDGQIIYERGYGMADLEHNIPITPTSVFRIASTSKQFTAACIAILAREGKLSLDDDIRKYIPELHVYDKPVTVRHLIHHISGIRDYLTLAELAGMAEFDSYNPQDSIEQLARQKRLNFSPGDDFLYSNSGYFLLGVIVQRVSGKSLNDFAQERIFKPLGMKNTHFHDDHTMIVKNRACGYSPTKQGYRISMTSLDHVGDGGVFTTVEDMFLWDQAFYTYQLGKELMELLVTPGVLNNGKQLDYAFGLVISDYKGLKTVGHGGSFVGFRTLMIRFPEQRFSVVCLANLSTINPSKLCEQVADIYLADQFKEEPKKEPKKKVTTITLSKKELEDKAGNYQDEKSGRWITVSVKDDKLAAEGMGEKLVLLPVSETRFEALDAPVEISIEFAPEIEGKLRKAKLTVEGEEESYLIKAPALAPFTPAQLQEYAGEYYNDELPATYKLVVENGQLVFKHRDAPKEPLKAMAPDKFTLRGMNINFTRDKKKRITGFLLGAGRAINIEFIKK